MQVVFHWVRVQTFCYATEKRELQNVCTLTQWNTTCM